MALDFIPLPHKVQLVKSQDELDDWGLPVEDSANELYLRARISYNTKRESISLANGEEITYTAVILLEGLPNVEYSDIVKWTDDFSRSHAVNPIEITYKHDMSGNPVAVRVVV